jgi:hypothetical protein
MTDDSATPVDVELLALYAEGLLDGTPDAEQVAGRLAADPDWQHAYAALPAATAGVSAQLAELAREIDSVAPEPVPADVLARIDAALAAHAPFTPPFEEAVEETYEPPTPLSAARERRGGRFRVMLAAAAVVAVVVVGGAVVVQQFAPRTESSMAGSGDGQPTSRKPAPAVAPANPQVVASGRDWTAGDLPALAVASGSQQAQADREKSTPNALSRFDNPSVLAACLRALQGLGGIPIYVDLARFAGSPAVLAVLANGSAHQVVAVAPNCGDHSRATAVYGPVPAG